MPHIRIYNRLLVMSHSTHYGTNAPIVLEAILIQRAMHKGAARRLVLRLFQSIATSIFLADIAVGGDTSYDGAWYWPYIERIERIPSH